jgi:hypothetical protein
MGSLPIDGMFSHLWEVFPSMGSLPIGGTLATYGKSSQWGGDDSVSSYGHTTAFRFVHAMPRAH